MIAQGVIPYLLREDSSDVAYNLPYTPAKDIIVEFFEYIGPRGLEYLLSHKRRDLEEGLTIIILQRSNRDQAYRKIINQQEILREVLIPILVEFPEIRNDFN